MPYIGRLRLPTTAELTAAKMTQYFEALDFKDHNHNNQLRVIRTLLNYGQQQGYLPEGVDLLKGVRERKVRAVSYPIYQPAEFAALLENAAPEMVPPFGTSRLLCGVRPAEMRELHWRDIRFETRTLVIDATQAKTASRRTVPLL